MKKVISLILCLIIFATLPIVAHAQIADYIIPDTSTIIAGVTGKDVPIHGTLPNYDAGTAFTIIVPGLYQDILVDKENVETHDLVKTEDKDEDTTPIIKEEIDE